jgi:autotransporter-associated beta strand protein
VAAPLCGAFLATAGLLSVAPARAQSFTWGGAGSSTNTGEYTLGTNWSSPPAGAPIAGGQSAIFDTTGSATVTVSSVPIAPDSWIFTANSQSYSISGAAVNFSLAGASGGIINNANSGQTISISNNIGESVAGVQVQQLGFSTLVLSGTNAYSGGTTVGNFGTLQVTNNNSVGSGPVTLESGEFQGGAADLTFSNNFKINNTPGGSAIDANGYALTISGNISGAGALTVLDSFGGGVVIFTGTNTYSGGTAICSCGTLQLGTLAATGSIIGAVTNEGIFNIVNANTAGITSIINDGETNFFNNSNAGSAIIVNRFDGLTTFNDFSSAMSANITNRSGGTTIFADNSSAGNATITNNSPGLGFPLGGLNFFDNSMAGTATIINNNHGLIVFGLPGGPDIASADHATIINNAGSELDFNAFTTAGSATITTNSGAATYFYDNSTGLNAQFITNGTGFVDFTESIGPNSDGRISAGSIAGSGFYYIGGGNTLIVGSNNLSTSVTGVIADNNPCGCTTGPGSLEKIGTGTLTLSGINTYTGTTTVFGGVLDVEGSIASSFLTTVNAGGALSGAGIVGDTMIAPGGIFLPGNGPPGSSMTVAGNLSFQSGALYLVTLNSTASTFANVIGTATLAGTVGAAFLPGSEVMKQYMILTANGGVSGGFAGVGLASPSGGLVATLSYDPTHAYLNFAVDFGAIPGLNVNQRNVGTTLTNFFNANGGIPVSFATLTPGGLTQASGELATGSQQATFDAMNLFMGLLTDPFVAGRGAGPTPGGSAPIGYASTQNTSAARDAYAMFTKAPLAQTYDPRWSVWAAGYGGSQTTDGNATLGSNTATSSIYGTAVGADYRISPFTVAGFALAGGGTNFSVAGSGSGHSDLFQAGAFIRHTIGQAYITAALAYGWQGITTDRTVTVAGSDQLRAQFDANAFSGRLEGGYRFVAPWVGGIGITPYAAAQFTTFDLPAYAEQAVVGSNAFALSYNAKDVTDTRSELGIRTDKSWAMIDGIFTLRGRVAWAHDYDPDRSIAATFQTLPGASFVVNGAAQASDSALVTASVEKKWLNGWSAAATFEGEFSDVTRSYAGKGVVRYVW